MPKPDCNQTVIDPPPPSAFRRTGSLGSFLRLIAALLGLMAVFGTGLAVAVSWSRDASLDELHRTGQTRASLYAAMLEGTLQRYAVLPYILAHHPQIVSLAADDGTTPGAVDRINRLLEDLNIQSQSADMFVLDRNGTILATSRAGKDRTLLGRSLAFRPYFRTAMQGEPGRFFAIGAITGESGYYLSHPIGPENEPDGVMVVKVDLAPLQETWRQAGETVMVTDRHGVVILSSDPAWSYHTLAPLPAETRRKLDVNRQYRDEPLAPLGMMVDSRETSGARIVHLPDRTAGPETLGNMAPRFYMQSVPLPFYQQEWSLHYLTRMAPVDRASGMTLLIGTVISGIIILLFLYLDQIRRNLREKLAAHDRLERTVAERTRDLSETNDRLRREVAERQKAEETLRATQEELVQAGKLAALGQMSAGIVHELNQPLAAIGTTVASARLLLLRGASSEARETLEAIGQLVGRMGRIIGHLKTFARKTPMATAPFRLRTVIDDALTLIASQIRKSGATVSTHVADADRDIVAYGDPIRLEHVFINLLRNAFDALEGADPRTVDIRIERDGDKAVVTIEDSGSGLSDEVLANLFDPFFTTKEVGRGLGLGLSISYGILRDMGGTIRAADRGDGQGARFVVTLPLAEEDTGRKPGRPSSSLSSSSSGETDP